MLALILRFLGLALLLLGLYGCQEQTSTQEQRYGEGYSRGFEDGKKEGYAKGYEEGFQRAAPGSERKVSGVWGTVQRVLVVIGALKILVALGLAIYHLIRKSHTREEAIGKFLMAALGSVIVLWTGVAVSLSDVVKSGLLVPASKTMVGWLLIGAFAAIAAYMIFLGIFTFLRRFQSAKVEAWSVFTASAVLTVFAPAFTSLLLNAPDINDYLASEILIGVLMGGTFYLAIDFLRPTPAVKSP